MCDAKPGTNTHCNSCAQDISIYLVQTLERHISIQVLFQNFWTEICFQFFLYLSLKFQENQTENTYLIQMFTIDILVPFNFASYKKSTNSYLLKQLVLFLLALMTYTHYCGVCIHNPQWRIASIPGRLSRNAPSTSKCPSLGSHMGGR